MKDWYLNLKKELVKITVHMLKLRFEIVKIGLMLSCKPEFLNDPNVLERYANLINMENDSANDILGLEKELSLLEESGVFFSITDLKDEIDFIHENITFETNYWHLTVEFLALLSNYSTEIDDDIDNLLIRNEETSLLCLNQVVINRGALMELKKERRDIIE